MEKRLLIGLGIAALMFGGVGSVGATIITTTATGIENYQWLSFDETFNITRDDVESTLLGTGQRLEGYRYATREETSVLLDSYYDGNILDVDDSWRVGTASAAEEFLNAFGYTKSEPLGYTDSMGTVDQGVVSYNYYESVNFYYGTDMDVSDPANSSLYGIVATMYFNNVLQAGFFNEQVGTDANTTNLGRHYDYAIPSMGIASLLVFDPSPPPTPTPEPATMLLFGTGLVGLVGSRLRRKKK